MFGSINTDPAYTFTQSEKQQATIHSLKILSNYFGENAVQENGQIKAFIKDPHKSNPLIEDDEKKDEESSKVKDGVEALFGDEEDDSEDAGLTYDGRVSSITNSFDALAAATGSPNARVTKGQLIALLQNLSSEAAEDPDVAKEVSFVKNLIAKFDIISDGESYITSFSGINEPQDYTTITKEQVTSPIDIRI